MMKVEDLDVLRPEARMIRIGGKDIDVSFIPCGITFEVDSIVRELQTIGMDKLMQNGEDTRKAFELSVRMCSVFCSRKNPEMDEAWFMENADANQIRVFSGAIKDALVKAYSGVKADPKNGGPPKKRK